jgi:mRNA-degrading endonuclease toxin of MazEF toxin-antitoxin module
LTTFAKVTFCGHLDRREGDRTWWSPTEMISVLQAIVVAPVTRTIRRIPQCIPLSITDGMDAECVATFDSLTVFDPALFDQRITSLSERRMHEICDALAAMADC